MHAMFPAGLPEGEEILPDAEEMMDSFLVGERQLLRYANQKMEELYDLSALSALTLIWAVYRQYRGLRFDPLTRSEAVSAALVYTCLLQRGQRPSISKLARHFGCSIRRLTYYACRITEVLSRLEEEKNDEDS